MKISEAAAAMGRVKSDKKAQSSRKNGKRGGRPITTIRDDCKVGIYDRAQYVARIYADKIIVAIPYIKWMGNTGGYAERKESIRDQSIVDEVRQEIADDAETTAWYLIGKEIGDEHLMNRHGDL